MGNSQIVTADEIFEAALRRLGGSAFSCIVDKGVRNLDSFLKLDTAMMGVKPAIAQEIMSTQEWVREQVRGNRSIAECDSERSPIQSLAPKQILPRGRVARSQELNAILSSLHTRTRNALLHAGVSNIGEFLRLESRQMIGWPNAGAKTVAEILNTQLAIRTFAMKCNENPTAITVEGVRKALASSQATQSVPSHSILPEQKKLDCVVSNRVIRQAAPWSILSKTLVDFYAFDPAAVPHLWNTAENLPVAGAVSLEADDWRRLANAAILRDDTSELVLALSAGHLLSLRMSEAGFNALRALVEHLIESTSDRKPVACLSSVSNEPIVPQADIAHIQNFRIGLFTEDSALAHELAGHGFRKWADLAAVSERSILEDLGPHHKAIGLICRVWKASYVARSAKPEYVYDSFGELALDVIEAATQDTRAQEILARRLGLVDGKVWTLGQIGKLLGVTRERVRQIDLKSRTHFDDPEVRTRLMLFQLAATEVLEKCGGAAHVSELGQEMARILGWGDLSENKAVVAFLRFDERLQIDEDQIAVLVGHRCLDCRLAPLALKKLFENDKSERRLQEVSDWIRGMCRSECAHLHTSFSEGYIRTIAAQTPGILVKGGDVYHIETWAGRKGTKQQLVESILLEAGVEMHYSAVSAHVRGKLPSDRYLSPHNVYALLGNCKNALLWNTGSYIHRTHANMPERLINEVYHWLVRKLRTGLPLVSIDGAFSEYQPQLVEAGVPSKYALYTCLRELCCNRSLDYPKFPDIVLSGRELVPHGALVEQFILDSGGFVSKHSLRRYVVEDLGISEQMFPVSVDGADNIVNAGRLGWIHTQNLSIDGKSLEEVEALAMHLVSAGGHVSVLRLFAEKQIACHLMGIYNARMLYSMLQLECSACLLLPGYPHIQAGSSKATNIKAAVHSFVAAKRGPCSFDELARHFVDGLGYTRNMVFGLRTTDPVVRYTKDSLIHLDCIEWSDEKQNLLEAEAARMLDRKRKAGQHYSLISYLEEHGNLPELPYQMIWTRSLIKEMLIRNGRFSVLGNAQNAYVQIPNAVGIETLEDLIHQLLGEYHGGANLAEFSRKMVAGEIILKQLTASMLGQQNRVCIKGGSILRKELVRIA